MVAGGGAAADLTAWPEFHNGVAAGLRLAADISSSSNNSTSGLGGGGGGGSGFGSGGSGGGGEGGAGVPPMWSVFQRPDVPTYTHAGTLMALGLTGHLNRLSWTDLYRCDGCLLFDPNHPNHPNPQPGT